MSTGEGADLETIECLTFKDVIHAIGPDFMRTIVGLDDTSASPSKGVYESIDESDPHWSLAVDDEGFVTFRYEQLGPYTLSQAIAVELVKQA